MEPLVSIVTPSYNQGKYIRQTIESVLNQNYPNIEYIIIDGGSTDDTLMILKEYEGKITYISEADKGQADAINKGFKMAKGEIVAWLNSDDVYEPGAIRKAVELFEVNPHIGLIYGEGYIIDEIGRKIKRFGNTIEFNLWVLLYVWDYIMQPTTFFRKTILETVGYLDISKNWIMDWDLWIRVALKYDIMYSPEFLACSREYHGTKTSVGGWKRLQEIKDLFLEYTGNVNTPGYKIFFWAEVAKHIRIPFLSKVCSRKAVRILKRLPIISANQKYGRHIKMVLRRDIKRVKIEGDVHNISRVYINEKKIHFSVLKESLDIYIPSVNEGGFIFLEIRLKCKNNNLFFTNYEC